MSPPLAVLAPHLVLEVRSPDYCSRQDARYSREALSNS